MGRTRGSEARNVSRASRACGKPRGTSPDKSRTRPAARSASSRAISINHQARESPQPMLIDSGPSGNIQRVPAGTFITSARTRRSSPGAPYPCRRMTVGPLPPPFPSVPPVSLAFKPPSMISRMGGLLMGVQILQQRHEAVDGGLNHGLLIERDERTLFVGFHFVDDELNLFHADIAILADF